MRKLVAVTIGTAENAENLFFLVKYRKFYVFQEDLHVENSSVSCGMSLEISVRARKKGIFTRFSARPDTFLVVVEDPAPDIGGKLEWAIHHGCG